MAHLDAMEVRHTALEVIFDLLMWYGLQAFMDQENSAENTIDRNIEAALESNISDTYTQGGNLSLNDLNSQGANPIVAVISKLLDDRDLDIRTKVCNLIKLARPFPFAVFPFPGKFQYYKTIRS